jgi:hypothetical protein
MLSSFSSTFGTRFRALYIDYPSDDDDPSNDLAPLLIASRGVTLYAPSSFPLMAASLQPSAAPHPPSEIADIALDVASTSTPPSTPLALTIPVIS